jgi:hypothetical protein
MGNPTRKRSSSEITAAAIDTPETPVLGDGPLAKRARYGVGNPVTHIVNFFGSLFGKRAAAPSVDIASPPSVEGPPSPVIDAPAGGEKLSEHEGPLVHSP